jgi:hypothetical protein
MGARVNGLHGQGSNGETGRSPGAAANAAQQAVEHLGCLPGQGPGPDGEAAWLLAAVSAPAPAVLNRDRSDDLRYMYIYIERESEVSWRRRFVPFCFVFARKTRLKYSKYYYLKWNGRRR